MLQILVLVGIAVLTGSTIGFAASLSTPPTFNQIGASDNNVVEPAKGNLTQITWNEEIGSSGEIEMNQIIFTVGNEDENNAHTFQVCAVIEGPVAVYSPSPGTIPACVITSNILPSDIETGQIISWSDPVRVSSIVDFSFTIEELT